MEVKEMPVVLNWKKDKNDEKGIKLPAIPTFTIEQMIEHYSMTYPEMATATAKPPAVNKDGEMEYEVVNTLGTKG